MQESCEGFTGFLVKMKLYSDSVIIYCKYFVDSLLVLVCVRVYVCVCLNTIETI